MPDLSPSPQSTVVSYFSSTDPFQNFQSDPPVESAQPIFMMDYSTPLASLLFEQEFLRKELRAFKELPNDWDGDGGAAIAEIVIIRVAVVLASLRDRVPAPDLIPNPNGTISLEWESGTQYCCLEIGEKDYSLALHLDDEPLKGVQKLGLPDTWLLTHLLLGFVYGQAMSNTSITAEKLAA